MDLISREWITQAMEHCPWDTERDRNRAIHYVRDIAPSAETTGALDEAIHRYVEEGLMELPTSADVRENVHNAWTGVDEFPHEVLECGHCGYLRMLETANDPWPNYCENCGAGMKGDSE